MILIHICINSTIVNSIIIHLSNGTSWHNALIECRKDSNIIATINKFEKYRIKLSYFGKDLYIDQMYVVAILPNNNPS